MMINVNKATSQNLKGEYYVIGKIPGYNSYIDSENRYLRKLLNDKIMIVDFRPVAMQLKTRFIEEKRKPQLSDLKELVSKKIVTDDFQRYMQLNKDYVPSWDKQYDGVRMLATVDSSVNNAYTHDYSDNPIEQAMQNLKAYMSGKTGDAAAALITGAKTVKYYTGTQYKESPLDLAELVTGHRVRAPKIWNGTNVSDILSLNIKLTSPSGDPASIENFIIRPLVLLYMMGAPVSFTGFDFSMPFTYEVTAYGIARYEFAAISSISLDRGGADVVFNKHGQPLTVNVRLTLIPLTTDAAAGITETAVSGYENTWYTTPKKIYESLKGYLYDFT